MNSLSRSEGKEAKKPKVERSSSRSLAENSLHFRARRAAATLSVSIGGPGEVTDSIAVLMFPSFKNFLALSGDQSGIGQPVGSPYFLSAGKYQCIDMVF